MTTHPDSCFTSHARTRHTRMRAQPRAQARAQFETDLAETCRRHNVGLLAYSPLGERLLLAAHATVLGSMKGLLTYRLHSTGLKGA